MPQGDTNTMFIEFRHVSETEGVTPAWWADRDIMLPGQLAAETYEESQRRPGDYEAQVSQRPIAIHGLEHLGATDRGVSMFRNQIRRGIRAVKAGDEPRSVCHTAGAVTLTYCNDTIVRSPPGRGGGRGPAADARDRAAAGRGLSQGSAADDPPLMTPRARGELAEADKIGAATDALKVTERPDYIGQIFQITPVPGIWSSGPLAGGPTKCVSVPRSRTAP